MGLSAKNSTVTISPAGGGGEDFTEQVTHIRLTPSVYVRKYGHDKSAGWQDVCAGIRAVDGEITCKIADCDTPCNVAAGCLVDIEVFPLGGDGSGISGQGVVTDDALTMNIENGDPVEHVIRFTSKGAWTGLVECGDFDCGSGGGDGGGSGLARPAVEPTSIGEEEAAAAAQPVAAEAAVSEPVAA